jgi:hypothetical protein
MKFHEAVKEMTDTIVEPLYYRFSESIGYSGIYYPSDLRETVEKVSPDSDTSNYYFMIYRGQNGVYKEVEPCKFEPYLIPVYEEETK